MIKIILILLTLNLSVLSADSLVTAKDARSITNTVTIKLKKKLLNSSNGKKAYNGLIKLFNKKISVVASKGYYNSISITFMNAPDKIRKLLRPLTRIEQDLIRSLIIEKLKKSGYIIKHNQFWDNPNSINITVIW